MTEAGERLIRAAKQAKATMDTVCWTTEIQIAKAQADPGHNMVIWGEPLPLHPDVALVRLSDAGFDPHIMALTIWGLFSDMGDDAEQFATAIINSRTME